MSSPLIHGPGPFAHGLHVATEQLLGRQTVAELDQADHDIPGLTTEPAWPTLRAHLLSLAADTGTHPVRHLLTAAAGRDLGTAEDISAILDWRLTALAPTNPGPLPWLPGIPPTLRAHPVWGDYLSKRCQLVADLADQVQDHACQGGGLPAWAAAGGHPTALVREIAVWRAASGINPQDPRPTGGGGELDVAAVLWKQRLDWHIARASESSGNNWFDQRQAPDTTRGRSDNMQRPYQKAERNSNGPAAPSR